MSNDTVVTATHRSPGPIASRSAMPARNASSAAAGTTTPFGRPVEPEV
jgi:hypothetical protein